MKAADIATRTAAQTTASSFLNGAPGIGQPVPPVWPDTICVAGAVEVCSSSFVAECDAAAPATTVVPATVVVAPIVGLYTQRDTALATLNAAKALEIQYEDMFDYRTAQTQA